ncbi:hypothetical protein H310_06618 [Aphanomyces invadans]|uniref:Uncharacterized protein n=1 Tax=Aphanomyces invadans TaxID=157072 RepID=A0A024U414_9STRA|nr:hypothetical protein H310_06618 [Aphanomyces invadans]ETW00974.1 hypothetical protein H310_06618 [Aphanomyces invadans]|eukprot:XP_008869972.1 hypothetical protein H310_06618 [Aphanomyces invadans]
MLHATGLPSYPATRAYFVSCSLIFMEPQTHSVCGTAGQGVCDLLPDASPKRFTRSRRSLTQSACDLACSIRRMDGIRRFVGGESKCLKIRGASMHMARTRILASTRQ